MGFSLSPGGILSPSLGRILVSPATQEAIPSMLPMPDTGATQVTFALDDLFFSPRHDSRWSTEPHWLLLGLHGGPGHCSDTRALSQILGLVLSRGCHPSVTPSEPASWLHTQRVALEPQCLPKSCVALGKMPNLSGLHWREL